MYYQLSHYIAICEPPLTNTFKAYYYYSYQNCLITTNGYFSKIETKQILSVLVFYPFFRGNMFFLESLFFRVKKGFDRKKYFEKVSDLL